MIGYVWFLLLQNNGLMFEYMQVTPETCSISKDYQYTIHKCFDSLWY